MAKSEQDPSYIQMLDIDEIIQRRHEMSHIIEVDLPRAVCVCLQRYCVSKEIEYEEPDLEDDDSFFRRSDKRIQLEDLHIVRINAPKSNLKDVKEEEQESQESYERLPSFGHSKFTNEEEVYMHLSSNQNLVNEMFAEEN
jgi:hypothetical protein